VALRLIQKLKEQGIKVIDGDREEIPVNAAYIFDFKGNEAEWKKLADNQKLVLVAESEEEVVVWKNILEKTSLNWRIVKGENVYGEGMSEKGFLGQAFWLAAKNKNLILPSLEKVYRVLFVDDLVEAILRSCFLSGTAGKIFIIGGKETNSKLVAQVLLDEAKMTRTRVIQDTESGEESPENEEKKERMMRESQELLRWQAETDFKDGAKETVSYFVAKIDAENRRKTELKNNDFKVPKEEEKREKRYEVEIEEEEKEENKENLKSKEREQEEIKIEIEEENKENLKPKEREQEEIEIEIEEENKENLKPKEEKEREIIFESFKKSPLPERKVEEESQAIMSTEADTSPVKEKESLKPKEEGRGGRKKNRSWRWGLGGVFFIIFAILVVNIIKLVTIPKNILGVQNLIEENKYSEAEKKIEKLVKSNEKNLEVFEGGKIGSLLRIETEVLDLLKLNLELSKSGEKIVKGLFAEEEVEMDKEILELTRKTEILISKMGILQGRLSGQWSWIPGRFKSDLNKIRTKIDTQRKLVEKTDEILKILPEMIGLDGKRKEYLVLLQNENELRPGGGFIGSFAILAFEDGHFVNFEVKDIYEADGQLKGHVEPPEEIKKYLGEAGWYMRDANWQASFPLVSRDIQWFLDKETGRRVDGVISLNLAAVKAVLAVVGEIFVPDFKEKVNENNLYEQAEFYSDNKFFAGSGQKASFLGGVSRQLMEEIKLVKGSEGQKLLATIIDLLDRNEIQISFNESGAAKIMAEAGWDGSIYEGKCNPSMTSQSNEQVACFADYLYIVEANLGVNKANYFLYRNIEREIKIEERAIKNNLKIIYENTSKSKNWPAGDYKNYLRIYLPLESMIDEVSWRESESGGKNMISGDDLKINQVGSKKEVGFLVMVPIGKKIEVEVKYGVGVDLTKVTGFSYLNYVQKQSGYGDTNIVSLVSIPENWQINAAEPVASVVGGKLLFNQKLERDIKMGVEIGR